jgi:hypothetical protein
MQLTRIPSTALYTPPAGPRFVFLLWSPPQQPPAAIALADTWADEGLPARVGWYAFVPAIPSGQDAIELEKHLRGRLASERGVTWGSSPFPLLAIVAIGLDDANHAAVATDAPVTLPPGLPELGFQKGLWLTGLGEDGPARLALADPAGEPRLGLAVELTSKLSGGVWFTAFLESQAGGDRSVKPLAAVRIDPLNPYDPERTRITPLGPRYVLVHEPQGGYRLEEAAA